jgi:DNA invertase Pin-like site-specific DNA recombinase
LSLGISETIRFLSTALAYRIFPLTTEGLTVKDAIGYLRVSTQEQGRSGLGLAAQRFDIERFGEREGFAIKNWYQDIQTGAGKDALLLRPDLAAALKEARNAGCPLIVSRLDRLSRNVHFIAGLMEHSVHFVVALFGRDVDHFTLHLYASIAEQERRMIGERRREAAIAEKKLGRKFGFQLRSKSWQEHVRILGEAARSKAADERAQAFRVYIEWVLKQPGKYGRPISFRAASLRLNERNIHTPFGKPWRGTDIKRMAQRLGIDQPPAHASGKVALARIRATYRVAHLKTRHPITRRKASALRRGGHRNISMGSSVHAGVEPPLDHRTVDRAQFDKHNLQSRAQARVTPSIPLAAVRALKDAVGYLRVSTKEQSRSGLGLAAQRQEIEIFGDKEGFCVKTWYQDIQTGSGRDALSVRPGLAAALKEAHGARCPLVVSRLDRLSRNVHFITWLIEHKVHFLVAALGRECDNFTLHIYASLAEQERTMISERIKAALARSPNRDKLGLRNPSMFSNSFRQRLQEAAREALHKAAMERAEAYRIHIEWALSQPGLHGKAITFGSAGEKLNELQIPSPMGGRWRSFNVAAIAEKLKLREKPIRVPLKVLQRRVNAIWTSSPGCSPRQVMEMLKPDISLPIAQAKARLRTCRKSAAERSVMHKKIGWHLDQRTGARICISALWTRHPEYTGREVLNRIGPKHPVPLAFVLKTIRECWRASGRHTPEQLRVGRR